ETGQRGAAVLRRILVSGARPTMAFQKLPMVVPAERANTQDPASVSHGFRKRLQHLETTPPVSPPFEGGDTGPVSPPSKGGDTGGVLAAGLATVQPWLDIPELGSAVVVVTDNDPQRAM